MNTALKTTQPAPVVLGFNQPRRQTVQRPIKLQFDSKKGIMMIKGDPTQTEIKPLINLLSEEVDMLLETQNKITCYLHFSSFDINTSFALKGLYKSFERHTLNGKAIQVKWFATGDNMMDMLGAGMTLADTHGVVSEFIPM